MSVFYLSFFLITVDLAVRNKQLDWIGLENTAEYLADNDNLVGS